MAKLRIEHYDKFLDLWKDPDPGIVEVEDANEPSNLESPRANVPPPCDMILRLVTSFSSRFPFPLALNFVAGKQGFEPRFHDPESCVLPLDDFPGVPLHHNGNKTGFQLCEIHFRDGIKFLRMALLPLGFLTPFSIRPSRLLRNSLRSGVLAGQPG